MRRSGASDAAWWILGLPEAHAGRMIRRLEVARGGWAVVGDHVLLRGVARAAGVRGDLSRGDALRVLRAVGGLLDAYGVPVEGPGSCVWVEPNLVRGARRRVLG